ncbi:MAG: Glycogen synthase [Verrucomicrobia subdivision 3 bacterium]|nr:Glycogen synthase [Limisphaerales bacterium]MCS1413271.1 Glycogen synthase [Limisphaerales bacterium]
MNILIGSSEVQPYSKTGGLADMVAALGKYLGIAGARVGVVTPLYRGLLEEYDDIRRTGRVVDVVLGERHEKGAIYECEPSANLAIYFVEHVHFFQRRGIYGEHSADYADNAERFLFLSKVLLNLPQHLPWRPDIVHVHDWPVAIFPALLRHEFGKGTYPSPPRTLCTIHNLAYQGLFPATQLPLTNLPLDYFTPTGLEYYGKMNFLKAGIAYADHVSTVSPSYAEEILTAEFGCGLEGILGERRDQLTGILNGVDYAEWNTTDNPHLESAYTADRISGKTREKKRLQRDLGLSVDAKTPLFGIISRLVEQKGIALLAEALQQSLRHPMQFVLLGSGNPDLKVMIQEVARRFPDQVRVKIGYDPGLAHRIEAACDFYLMPSRFEPCGLNQLYSLRYGTIPVVHAAGGLRDSVADESEGADEATGIKFTEFTSAAVLEAIYRALSIFKKPELLHAYQKRGMARDFSWERTAEAYLDFYRRILGGDGADSV